MTETNTTSSANTTKLYETIARLFQVDPGTITDSSSHDTIGAWDSLGMVNLVSELEVEFNVEFDLLEIADFNNVGSVKNVLRSKGVNLG